MSKRALLWLFALGLLGAALFHSGPARASGLPLQDTARLALVLRLEGPLNPIWEVYLARGLEAAQTQSASVVILELNTPGGSIDLMNKLVQQIRSSSIPIVVYVAPNGAMAGSAGTMLTLAGHASAMAPETAIGAASPVDEQGQDIGSTMESKIKEILKATARSLTERRGPQAQRLADQMIDEARAVSASEAVEAGLVDIKASGIPDLLAQLEGRTVYLSSGASVSLRTAGAAQIPLPVSPIEEFLQILANPNLVLVLLAVGVQALLIELTNPGAWVPGFIAAVCLTLAVFGLGILPVNWFGLIFILLACVLFILETQTPAVGGLAAAGAVSFVIGALVLFNSVAAPGVQRVSVPLVIGAGAAIGLFFAAVMWLGVRAQRRPVLTGTGGLVGQVGVAREELAPAGPVQLGSELWSATLEDARGRAARGSRVEVTGIDGLTLRVREVKDSPEDGG